MAVNNLKILAILLLLEKIHNDLKYLCFNFSNNVGVT
jgi:hypothetical protein